MLIARVEIATEAFAQVIAVAHDAHASATTTGPVISSSGAMGGWTQVDLGWWREHGDALIESKGGLTGVIDHRFAWLLAPINIGSLSAGIFWSVCLLGARRRTVVLPAMLPLVVAFAIVWLAQGDTLTGNAATAYAHDIATETVKWAVLPLMGGTAGLSLLLGVWQGRRVARTAVRLSLPPRMRSALAILWTRDGLAPPVTRIA